MPMWIAHSSAPATNAHQAHGAENLRRGATPAELSGAKEQQRDPDRPVQRVPTYDEVNGAVRSTKCRTVSTSSSVEMGFRSTRAMLSDLKVFVEPVTITTGIFRVSALAVSSSRNVAPAQGRQAHVEHDEIEHGRLETSKGLEAV